MSFEEKKKNKEALSISYDKAFTKKSFFIHIAK